MTISVFAYVAILLIVALLSTRLMKILKLPNVTGYILTGIIAGPFVLGLFFNGFNVDEVKSGEIYNFVQQLSWLPTMALGFIAFNIGTSFKKAVLKSVGKRVIIITILESLFASALVIVGLLIAHFIYPDKIPLALVLTLGAIAAATAPAATLMVIKQYRAKGELVDTLLPVVALDDASALILFAVLFQIATNVATSSSFSLYAMIFKPLIEIGLSLAFGAVFGFIISFMNRFFKSRNNKLILCIFAIFGCLGIYYLFKYQEMGGFELSSLLMCMMAGAIYTNMAKDSDRTLDIMDRFTNPIYLMFFVLSGASLDLSIFFSTSGLVVVAIGVVYIIFRGSGKWLGAYTGATITKSPEKVKKYLGLTLIPQAGVAIGLATTANTLFSGNELTKDIGAMIIAVILTSTLILEIIGPLLSKYALKKAGEIQEE